MSCYKKNQFYTWIKILVCGHKFGSQIIIVSLLPTVLGLDIQDEMGRHEVGFVENILKTPLGTDEEGCRFEGRFYINKVSTKFNIHSF